MEKRTIQEQLLDKSKEAFILAIEIYNKPSIKYRLEGFSFLICNAWELMLKAHLINQKGASSIYFSDKPNRTIPLEKCVQLIFTNETSPLRKNLEKIIELRNTSTHFITEEYESIYIPLLQACVFNFVEKMLAFHNIDMTSIIPENFITLSVRLKSLNETEIRGKYDSQIADRLIKTNEIIQSLTDNTNKAFAIRVEHFYYATKKKEEATEVYHIEKEAKDGVRIIKELKNPNDTHKYNIKDCLEAINNKLRKNGIYLIYKGKETQQINKTNFINFVKYFNLKNNERMCFVFDEKAKQPQYRYSQQAVDFVYNELIKAPERILDDLRKKLAKR